MPLCSSKRRYSGLVCSYHENSRQVRVKFRPHAAVYVISEDHLCAEAAQKRGFLWEKAEAPQGKQKIRYGKDETKKQNGTEGKKDHRIGDSRAGERWKQQDDF